MPELPEVETVRRGLEGALAGRRLRRVMARRPDLRIPLPEGFADRLTGRRVRAVRRRAKYLLIDLDDDTTLIAHLGMSGSFLIRPEGEAFAPRAHDHVVFDLDEGPRIVYCDPRRFGLMTLAVTAALEDHPFFAGLGPEPLGNAFNERVLSERLRGKQTPIKAALLDQAVVAGLGNIYVSEALWRAGISPRRKAASVAGARAARLAPAIRAVLAEAIESGGSSLRDHAQVSGEMGYFQHQFSVYDQAGQPCPRCGPGFAIQRLVQSGRSSFFCGHCQK